MEMLATAQETAMSSRQLKAVESARALNHVVIQSALDKLQNLSAGPDS
jgi:hypothetical protein